MLKKIQRALISVTDKQDLEYVVKILLDYNIDIISTGSTAQYLQDIGIKVLPIQDYTNFPEILDGRVKTLHPKIHGGILATDHPDHVNILKEHEILDIDLIIVNLYQFEKAITSNSTIEECIKHIDIGGPTLIRAAAKNMLYRTVITDSKDYSALVEELNNNNGSTSYEFRCKQAQKAFTLTAHYDTIICNWLAKINKDSSLNDIINFTATRKQDLRYGENSHQKAGLYFLNTGQEHTLLNSTQIQGKALSYNNLLDADAAVSLIREFTSPTAVIIKHTNPCGAATAFDIISAYKLALASDMSSAFGSIIALNRPIDSSLATELSKLFVEVIIAPSIDKNAHNILCNKQNLRILLMPISGHTQSSYHLRSIDGGILIQEQDTLSTNNKNFQIVTTQHPTEKQIEDLLFAYRVCKHVKSNAIVIASNQSTIGIGAGQMSRVDSVKIALSKATDNLGAKSIAKAVLASDAFFPFPDSITMAAKAGIKAIIQPGGSIRDQEIIKAANEYSIAMIFTGSRHFKH
ncbi:Bifunctional purine biosynthesis protein PurH [Rickettsiales bacterium Ac37b]|nr:Bifunctional purine biosynthesis protein PurH [Rickettsiales bacterium Ac37b]